MNTLAAVNAMSLAEFMAAFGDVAEHSPWVAEAAAGLRPYHSNTAMIEAFTTTVEAAPKAAKLALIRLHPDLANKARLSDDSTKEQAGVGLNRLTTEEFARFTTLNNDYKTRFGFPFIFAVKGATKFQILESFGARINNDADVEFTTALTQVCRIMAFRINDRVSS